MADLRAVQTSLLRRAPPGALSAALTNWRRVKRQRRRAAESVGIRRYSRPALFDIDRQLQVYLPRQGVFVEAGAYDGFRQSNTYYLERWCGWTGLLIEPVPWLAEQARRDRTSPVVCSALVAPDYPSSTIQIQARGLMSAVESSSTGSELGVAEQDVHVAASPLSDVLDQAGISNIDFLSLDVEGYEVSALSGMTRHLPRFILIEINGDRESIEATFSHRYTMIAQLSFHDFLYALES